MDGEWISAADAYELVSSAAPFGAAVAICSRAHDGLVKARAKRIVVGDQPNDDREIPAGFWWARGHAALKQNWTSGDFETWIDHKFHCRAFGVEFSRADIEAMIPGRERRSLPLDRSAVGNYAPAAKCLQELQTTLGRNYRRIEAVAMAAGALRVLDLTDGDVRKAVAGAADAKSLYEGGLSSPY